MLKTAASSETDGRSRKAVTYYTIPRLKRHPWSACGGLGLGRPYTPPKFFFILFLKEKVLLAAWTGRTRINNARILVVLPIQALSTAVTIIHKLSFKHNTTLRADKKTGIPENHKLRNCFGHAELHNGQQEMQRYCDLPGISPGFHFVQSIPHYPHLLPVQHTGQR